MKPTKQERLRIRQEQVSRLVAEWRRERISRSFTALLRDGPALYLARVKLDAIEIHFVRGACGLAMQGKKVHFFDIKGRHPLQGNEFRIGNRCFLIKEEASGFFLFQTHPRLREVSGFCPVDKTDPDFQFLRLDSVWAQLLE